MAKQLKLWNGRWKNSQRIYVAAYSVVDAVLIGRQAVAASPGWWSVTPYEIIKYWSSGAWCTQMEGVEPERGAWIAKDWRSKPERVV